MHPRVGLPAPEFTLPAHTGGAVSLADLRGRTVILNFFPLAFSGVCSEQFRRIGAGEVAWAGADAAVLGVSVDSSDTQAAFAHATGAEGVTFLSDFQPRGTVAEAYGVFAADRGHSIRATFVIDRGGVLRHAEIPPTPLDIPDGASTARTVAACAAG